MNELMNSVTGMMPGSQHDLAKSVTKSQLPTSPADFAKAGLPKSPAAIVKAGMPPTPAQVGLNYLLYTLYSLVGTLIYYPAFIANIPESTLEDTLPKQDLCMKMGFSKRICQKKIKCLLKNCDYLDDPHGYKLDKQYKMVRSRKVKENITEKNIMTGGKNKTRKYKKNNWNKYLTRELKKKIRQEYQKNILAILVGKKRKYGKKKKNTKKYYGGRDPRLNNTCRHKKTGILCNLNERIQLYTEPTKLARTLQKKTNLLTMFGGGSDNGGPLELIKKTVSEIAEKHNKELHEFIEENSENISKLIDDFKKKYPKAYPMAIRIINYFPTKIAKFIEKNKEKIIQYVAKLDTKKLTQIASEMSKKMSNSATAALSKTTSTNEHIESEEEIIEKKSLIRSFFVEKLKTETLFKLAIVIKIMKEIIERKEIKLSDKNKSMIVNKSKGTSVIFPWIFNNPEMCLSDKIKCLSAHITQTKIEEDSELYNKCFICKHCTLRNTASSVWENVIKGILSGNKSKQFDLLINELYGLLIEHIKLPFMSDKQYYFTTLISLHLAMEELDIEQLTTKFTNEANREFELKELILGIPSIFIENISIFNNDLEKIKTYYQEFKELGIIEEINGIYYESLTRKFFEIEPEHSKERLDFLKKVAFKNYELLYVKNKNMNNRWGEGVYEKFYNNSITSDEMERFSHFIIPDNDNLLQSLYSWDYPELSNQLQKHLEDQYKFLLEKNNFHSTEYINDSIKDFQVILDDFETKREQSKLDPSITVDPATQKEERKNKDLMLLRNIALKLF
jgi:hypothetical protein